MDIKDIAKQIRKQLKQEFSQCKFSVRISRFSMGQSLTVALMQAPFTVFAKQKKNNYVQLNQYQLRRSTDSFICNGAHLTPEAWKVMAQADKIVDQHNWDHSDPQTDYYSTNFNANIAIGQWNKPFAIASKQIV